MIIKIKPHNHTPAGDEPHKKIVIRKPGAAPAAAPAAAAPAAPAAPRKISRNVPPDISFLRFESIVGRGGMSVVWRAWHLELERFVAVKVLDADFAASGRDVRQFMHEVRTLSCLHHPGIVRGYGADCADGRYFMIMDFVDGYTFGSLLTRKKSIPEPDGLVICEAVADAMKYAWENFGLVHCDIKPENIMVDRDGTVKITDLGLCRSSLAKPAAAGAAEEIIGTPAYMSPEQIYGDAALDCRADIYSLGASIYHLVAGRTLFPLNNNDDILRAHVSPTAQAPDPRSFSPAISEGFAHLLARMLVKEKSGRFQNWDDVFAAAELVENGGTPLPPDKPSSIKLARKIIA